MRRLMGACGRRAAGRRRSWRGGSGKRRNGPFGRLNGGKCGGV